MFPKLRCKLIKLFILFLANLFALLNISYAESIEKTNQEDADRSYFTETKVIDQNGKSYRFYSDLLKNRVVAINFGFTACNGSCPISIKNLKEAYEKAEKEKLKDVLFLWISVDKNDSEKSISDYAKKMKIPNKNFLILTGKNNEMSKLVTKFGQKVNEPETHTNIVFVGNLKTGIWNKATSIRNSSEIYESIKSVY